MRKVAMIFKIKFTRKEPKKKIEVTEETHGETCEGSPVSNLLTIHGFRYDRARERMSQTIHSLMPTCAEPIRQWRNRVEIRLI